MKLDKVSIGIKTFLRDEKLFHAIRGIQERMPEVELIIADDGEETPQKSALYADLNADGHTAVYMGFDAGFGLKSNTIAHAFTRDYLLIGSDDFDFSPPSVREGIEKMTEILDKTDVDIISGRVGQHGAYEFNLEDLGDKIIEHQISIKPPYRIAGMESTEPWFIECDLTVNYSLVKRHVFDLVHWDDDVKIGGGEHGAFFVDAKRAGLKVAWTPGVSIQEQEGIDSARYRQYRMRSSDRARPCFDKRGIREYVLGGGHVDYKA